MSGAITPGGRRLQSSGGLSTEAILTTHRILGAFGRDARTFDILHADLFDSRQEVVLSALRALAGTKDQRSFMYVARLFRHPDPEIVCAAVKAGGAIAPPDALPIFFKLATSSRVESVLLELLRAMARCRAEAPEVRQLATALSRSVTAHAETRAAAIEILVRLDNGTDTGRSRTLLNEDRAVQGYIFQSARKDEVLGRSILEAFGQTHQDLPPALRSSLIPLAAPLTTEAARAVFFASLEDANDGIRRECYRYVGAFTSQLPWANTLCARLLSHVESTPALEEEALEAIDTLDAALRAAPGPVALPCLDGQPAVMANLFRDLRLAFVTDIDTTHDTGHEDRQRQGIPGVPLRRRHEEGLSPVHQERRQRRAEAALRAGAQGLRREARGASFRRLQGPLRPAG